MYFVVDTANLKNENGYKVYTAGAATSVPWSGVTGKPSTFTPSAHNQASNTITSLTGYVKGSNAAISATDSLNVALGKLEAKADSKANTSDLAKYLPLTGGTITSNLNVNGSITTNTIVHADASGGESGMLIYQNDRVYVGAADDSIINPLVLRSPSDPQLRIGGSSYDIYSEHNLTNVSQLNNDANYITSSALSGYATQTWVTQQGYTKNTGTVTSISLRLPSGVFTHDGQYITESGELTAPFKPQKAHTFFGGPPVGADGTPTFRKLVATDIPDLSSVYLPVDGTIGWDNVTGKPNIVNRYITINGTNYNFWSDRTDDVPDIFAPTTWGASGQILQSNGTSNAPTWINKSTITNGFAPLESPNFTGTPTAPTQATSDNSTKIATTAFVKSLIGTLDGTLVYKGPVNSNSDIPANHTKGWTYIVNTAGTYVGEVCEVGDMIVCLTSGTTANNAHWNVIQTNVNGVVTGPSSSVDGQVALFSGTTGKLLKNTGNATINGILTVKGINTSNDIIPTGTNSLGGSNSKWANVYATNVSATTLTGNLTGNATTATTASKTTGTLTFTGGATGTFNGSEDVEINIPIGGTGTVKSVAMTVPTGLSVSGTPITTSGTFAITYASGYSIPTTAKQSNWDTAFGWGNHASAGYTKNTGTVTSITLTQGEGITITNSGTEITTSGKRTISLSTATNTTKGGVKPWMSHTGASTYNGGSTAPTANGASINVNALTTTTGRYYAIETDAYGRMFVNVPWTDTNTNYYPTKFTWTNGTTAGPTGSLTVSGASAVSFGAIPAASTSQSGVVTTGAQTFSGEKTFNGGIVTNYVDAQAYIDSQEIRLEGTPLIDIFAPQLTHTTLSSNTVSGGYAYNNTSARTITTLSGFNQINSDAVIVSTAKITFSAANIMKMDGLDDLSGTYYIYCLSYMPNNKIAINGAVYA